MYSWARFLLGSSMISVTMPNISETIWSRGVLKLLETMDPSQVAPETGVEEIISFCAAHPTIVIVTKTKNNNLVISVISPFTISSINRNGCKLVITWFHASANLLLRSNFELWLALNVMFIVYINIECFKYRIIC